MDFKLGVGPMSYEIVNAIAHYTIEKNKPLMMIASRNQVDADSGYVMTTPQLAEQLKNIKTDNLWLCRDHCGPYFLDSEKNLPLKTAIEAAKKTIAYDIEQGFDLIHIDTSRCGEENSYSVAEELFKFCLDKNPNIKFEFGTEENVGVSAGVTKYKNDVEFAKNFPNLKFVVAQTGSLCFEDTQAGDFQISAVEKLVRIANQNGVGLKEHNADYLTSPQVALRKYTGVHALNIAPQLGVVQTKLLKEWANKANAQKEWDAFANVVLASNRWKKWTHSDSNDQKVIVAGHYCFNSPEYQNIVEKINELTVWEAEVSVAMFEVFDNYVNNLY